MRSLAIQRPTRWILAQVAVGLCLIPDTSSATFYYSSGQLCQRVDGTSQVFADDGV
jgi:hypothetical protein